MDLLIQVTTANKINPGGHVIQVLNDRSDDFLYYKPSTPIGKNQINVWLFIKNTKNLNFFSLYVSLYQQNMKTKNYSKN